MKYCLLLVLNRDLNSFTRAAYPTALLFSISKSKPSTIAESKGRSVAPVPSPKVFHKVCANALAELSSEKPYAPEAPPNESRTFLPSDWHF